MPVYKDEKRKTWFVSVRYTNWKGQPDRKVKRGFKREKDAKQWERDFLNQEAADCDMTLGALTDIYFDDLGARLRESTIETKKNIFDTHILPHYKDTPVNKITPASIRRWQAEVIRTKKKNGEPFKPTYLKSIHNQINALMNYAVRFYHLQQNPCFVAGSMGKKDADEMNFWTIEEFNQAIKCVLEIHKRLAFNIMFWCGLRVSETLALTPADILPNGSIRVIKQHRRKDGQDIEIDPKSERGFRDVTAPDWLLEEINSYCSRLYGLQEKDRIFDFTRGVLNMALDRAADEAQLTRIRVHDLRHSHAAMLIEMGYSLKLVAERLGDTLEVVMRTYSHLYPDKQQEVAKNLSNMRDGITVVSEPKKDPDF